MLSNFKLTIGLPNLENSPWEPGKILKCAVGSMLEYQGDWLEYLLVTNVDNRPIKVGRLPPSPQQGKQLSQEALSKAPLNYNSRLWGMGGKKGPHGPLGNFGFKQSRARITGFSKRGLCLSSGPPNNYHIGIIINEFMYWLECNSGCQKWKLLFQWLKITNRRWLDVNKGGLIVPLVIIKLKTRPTSKIR